MHGHTWRLRATWAFQRLDESGMGANFSTLKSALEKRIVRAFDHRHLNDLPPFESVVPTAENLARECYRLLSPATPEGGRLERVEVWEGPENCVIYEEI